MLASACLQGDVILFQEFVIGLRSRSSSLFLGWPLSRNSQASNLPRSPRNPGTGSLKVPQPSVASLPTRCHLAASVVQRVDTLGEGSSPNEKKSMPSALCLLIFGESLGWFTLEDAFCWCFVVLLILGAKHFDAFLLGLKNPKPSELGPSDVSWKPITQMSGEGSWRPEDESLAPPDLAGALFI